jgi:hypothetical protein
MVRSWATLWHLRTQILESAETFKQLIKSDSREALEALDPLFALSDLPRASDSDTPTEKMGILAKAALYALISGPLLSAAFLGLLKIFRTHS